MSESVQELQKKLAMQRIAFFVLVGFFIITIGIVSYSIRGLSGYISAKDFPVQTPTQAANRIIKESASDRVLVKFSSGVGEEKRKAVLLKHELIEAKEIGNTGVKVVKIKEGKSPRNIVSLLKREEKDVIEFAETDDLNEPALIPSDPYFVNSWHLPRIEVENVWDEVNSEGILVGVCDTGFNVNHPDLSGVFRTELALNTVDNTTNISPVYEHGTLISGVISAVLDNGVGVSGITGGADIVPVRISNRSDGRAYVSDAAECISYVSGLGVKAINLSYRMAEYDTIHQAALEAESLGAVTSVSAGNENSNPNWPDFSSFLVVSATDENDNRVDVPGWWGSNYGTYVDIAAPGVNVLTTSDDGSYKYANGTSLATPIVTATAALISAANSSLTAAQVKDVLLVNADDLGPAGEDIYYGAGRVNAYKAVSTALGYLIPQVTPTPTLAATPTPTFTPTPTPIPDTTPPSVPQSLRRFNNNAMDIPLDWDPSTDDTKLSHYNVYRNGSLYDSISVDFYIDDNTGYSGLYEYSVSAVDEAGNESERSEGVYAAAVDANSAAFYGRVTDLSTGEPVAGVQLSAKRALKKKQEVGSAVTDSNGYYVLVIKESGDFEITATANGYAEEKSGQLSLFLKTSKPFDFSLSVDAKGSGGGNDKKNPGRGNSKNN